MRLFALLLVSMLASVSQAQTRLSVVVNSGQTHIVQPGNYFVDFRVIVYAGGKIVFRPGVNIEVRSSTYWLMCGGESEFQGTALQPITITTIPSLANPGTIGLVNGLTGSTVRPKMAMNHTNFSSHGATTILAERADFQVSNCNLINSSTSATKSIFRVSRTTFGTVQDSVLDLVSKTGYGLNVGQSATATDSTGIDLFNVAVLNSAQPINIQKIAPIAVLNGSID
jgi:hypothetical protein